MRGALVMLSTAQMVPNYFYGVTTPTPPYTYLQFDAAPFFDTDGIYDLVNRDRMKVPAALDGMWAKVKISVRWDSGQDGDKVQILPTLVSGGVNFMSAFPASAPDNRLYIGGTTTDHCSETHPIKLHTDDYFRAAAWQCGKTGTGPALRLMAASFSLEILA